MAMVSTNETEKAAIKHLLSAEGKNDMKNLIKETTTYADLFLRFPSTVPKIEYMLQYINPIKPRLYSIASHPEYFYIINIIVLSENKFIYASSAMIGKHLLENTKRVYVLII